MTRHFLRIILFLLSACVAAYGQSQYTYSTKATGTNTYTAGITGFPGWGSADKGVVIDVKFLNPNTASSTLEIGTAGAVTLKKLSGGSLVDLASGDILAGYTYRCSYNGTYLVVGAGTMVETVTGDGVDNTDPANPILTFPTADEVDYTPAGGISATQVGDAIDELDAEKLAVANNLSDVASAPSALQNIHALDSRIEIIAESGSRSLTTADFPGANGGQVIELQLTSGSAQTITVPTNASQAIAIGEYIQFRATGVGGFVLSAAGGVTITSTTGSLAGPAQGFVSFLKKEGTNTWRFDNGQSLGSANQVYRMNSAGTSAGYGSIDLSQSAAVGSSILSVANGGTGSSTAPWWPLTGTGTLTGNVTMAGAYSVGHGVTPTSKFHLQGLASGTASMFKLQNSTATVLFDMTESGVTTQTGSASGAGATVFNYTPTLTATASSQTQFGFDLNMTVVDGGFTNLTRSFGGFRLGGSSTRTYDFQTTSFTTNLLNLFDLRLAGDFTVRNPLGALYIRGGGGGSAGTAVKIGTVISNSTDNSIGVDLTSTLFAIPSGSGLTRTFTAFRHSWVLTSTSANTINAIGWDYNPDLSSVGGSTVNHYLLWRSGNMGLGDNTPGEKLSVAGNIKTRHLIGQSTAPSIAAGSGAGTGPTVSLSNSTDIAGLINVTTGSSPSTAATVVTITFNAAYGTAPNVIITPAGANAAALSGTTQVYTTSTTTTFVITSGSAALTASTDYKWFFHVIQ